MTHRFLYNDQCFPFLLCSSSHLHLLDLWLSHSFIVLRTFTFFAHSLQYLLSFITGRSISSFFTSQVKLHLFEFRINTYLFTQKYVFSRCSSLGPCGHRRSSVRNFIFKDPHPDTNEDPVSVKNKSPLLLSQQWPVVESQDKQLLLLASPSASSSVPLTLATR